MALTASEIARLIDHTLLKPEATREEIGKLCAEALKYGFASVCVNPWNVLQASELLRRQCCESMHRGGIPVGATLPEVKAFETQEALKRGAQEIDMVINIGALKSGRLDDVAGDIRGVVETAHCGGGICKVILETALLTRDEKVAASLAAKNAGADFETSTGFSSAGATPEDVRLIRETIGRAPGQGRRRSAHA